MKRMTFRHIPRQLFGLTRFIRLSRVLCLSVFLIMLIQRRRPKPFRSGR
jgi:hypothetical protein